MKSMLCRVALVVVVAAVASSVPVKRKLEISGTTSALMYLNQYGYIDPTASNPQSGALLSGDSVRNSIIDFQAFAGLEQTGELDDATIEMMNRPRCGNKDIVGHGSNTKRRKRYALQGSRWRVRELTYSITKYPQGLDEADVDEVVAKAFQVWEGVSNLSFKPVTSGKVHIEIKFETGEHGDGDPFDRKGGTLAHAYFPVYGGDAHFDDDETWTIASYRGTNLFQVAAHEFGHSLGLSHSDVKASLMAPFYRGYERNFKLDSDDTTAIQALYGKKQSPSAVTTPRPSGTTTRRTTVPASPSSPLCRNPKIDAIVTMQDKNTYVFKGSQYWKLTDDATAPGYPRSISANWDGLPSDVDAAFTWTNGKTYIFKGSQYWRYSNMTLDTDYPKAISKGFAGIPNNIDAGVVWSGNGKIYFFKNDQYWRFDPTSRPPVKNNYPEALSTWEGLPNGIDDALQYKNGYTYFFKDGQYWRFNDRAFRVDTADPPFPRPVGYWWFGCETSGSLQTFQEHEEKSGARPANENDVGEEDQDAVYRLLGLG